MLRFVVHRLHGARGEDARNLADWACALACHARKFVYEIAIT